MRRASEPTIRIVLVMLLAAIGLACTGSSRRSVGTSLEECGHGARDSARVAIIVDTYDVPEFHDCQRFIVRENGKEKYGPLMAIFASATLPVLLKSNAGSSAARLPRPAGRPPRAEGEQPSQAANAIAYAIAVIDAEGQYPPLGLEPGVNCLYMYWSVGTSDDTTWSARMSTKAATDGCKDVPVSEAETFKTLRVLREVATDPFDPDHPFAAPEDYPPVARWDWDEKSGQQYIGIVCGYAWCEIGSPVFQPSPPLSVSVGDSRSVRRLKRVKAWYDQQRLATSDAAGKPVPTHIIGTILPDTLLATKDDFSSWNHVADVSLYSPLSSDANALKQYKKKFEFRETKLDAPAAISIEDPKPDDDANDIWKSKIVPPTVLGGLLPKRKNVKFRQVRDEFRTKGYKVPGTARWRWMRDDEGTWTRCKYGCCEISNY